MAMKEEQKKKLWDAYKKNKTPEIREQLIIEYANLVNLVAGRMGMYLGYTVEYDDRRIDRVTEDCQHTCDTGITNG